LNRRQSRVRLLNSVGSVNSMRTPGVDENARLSLEKLAQVFFSQSVDLRQGTHVKRKSLIVLPLNLQFSLQLLNQQFEMRDFGA
jgi:hypothetical protein